MVCTQQPVEVNPPHCLITFTLVNTLAEPPEAMVSVTTIATFKFSPNLKLNRVREDNEKAKLFFISQKEYILLKYSSVVHAQL